MDTSEYHKRVDVWLKALEVRVTIKPSARQDCPPERCKDYLWKDEKHNIRQVVPHNHGHKYDLTLERADRPTINVIMWNSLSGRYKVQFGERLIELRAEKTLPSAYDVISCYSPDFWANQETFEEYCSNRGDDTDSIKALGYYNEAVKTAILFQRMFNEDELQALADIAS